MDENRKKALAPPWARSRSSSARARSCASAMQTHATTWRPSPPARSASTSRSASAACRAAAWSRSTARSPRARPRSRCTSIAEAQKPGGTAAFIDAEHALDPAYAEKLGVNMDDLLVSQPDTGEQALEIADMLVRSGAVDVVVVDSVAALTPKAEIEGEMGDSHMGLQARLMSQALRKLTGNIKRSNTHRHLHQPDPHEDRRDVRQPGDHHRRQRAQVLRLGAPRHPPHRRDQEGRRGRRQPDPRQGGEEQGRAAVPRGRVRHPVRRRASRAKASSSTSAWRTT